MTDYIVKSSRGKIEDCAVYISQEGPAIAYAKETAQRQGFPYEVFKLVKIGEAVPVSPRFDYIETEAGEVAK